MNNSIFSKRIIELSKMVDNSKTVYDVGCDHAYLDIYLKKYCNVKDCYAIDIRKSIIETAKKNISDWKLDIKVLLNNGLDDINIVKNSVVVIAGMGTKNILKILKDKKIDEMIIQSNDDIYLLRKTLIEWGYKITDEKVVYDNCYYYVLIKFSLGTVKYTEEEMFLGPILIKKNEQSYIEYLKYLDKKYDRMIKDIPEELSTNIIKYKLNQNIIKKYLNN